MGVIAHSVTYQGIPCKGVSWTTTPGLQPNHGHVDIDLADLKAIKLEARGIAWRSPHGAGVMPSPIPINVWHKHKPAGSATTAPEVKAPSSGGLAALGDLVCRTSLDGALMEEVRIHDVYVSPDGVEELPPTPAGRREHNVGTVRVRITDIRAFYDDHGGAFLGGINVRLDAGRGPDPKAQYDHNTTNRGVPWALADVLGFLFSQLPGSPIFLPGQSELEGLQPPVDLVGTGEPVKQVLASLLDRCGLEARLQPDGTYIAARAASTRVPYGSIPSALGKNTPVDNVREEKKTVAPQTPPRAVLVVGRRIIRRVKVAYVPVFKDPRNDRIYPLKDVERVMGYPLERVNKEVFAAGGNFRDVFPGNKGRLSILAGDMLRTWAYKAYAPAMAFGDLTQGVLEKDLATLPGLPAQEAPWYKSELDGVGAGRRATSVSGDTNWVLHPPVFFATRFAQGKFDNYEAMEEFMSSRGTVAREVIQALEAYIADLRKAHALAVKSITAPHDRLRENVNQARAAGLGFPGLVAAASKDILVAGTNIATLGTLRSDQADKEIADLNDKSQATADRLARQIASAALSVKNLSASIRKGENHWDNIKETFKAYGGVHGWFNHPHGIVDGGYLFDPQTGLLMFNRPTCSVEQAFAWQPEGCVVANDGVVYGVWAYEDKAHSPSAWTTALYVAEDNEGDAIAAKVPDVVCAGVGHSSQVTPKAEREPKMRLYVNEFGDPFNLTDVVTAGLARAEGALKQLRGSVGYAYELQHFQPAVLDWGVSSVGYSWDAESQRCSTHVAINYRGARGPSAVVARATAHSPTTQVAGGEAATQVNGGV